MQRLSATFLAAWTGGAATDGVEAALDSICERAAEAWGRPLVDRVEFCRYLGERAPRDVPPVEALERLRADELYLACACARGVPEALRVFDERLLSRVGQHLGRLRADAQLADETRQALRARLFVPDGNRPARITQYSGLGPLDGWVRVAAVRVALNLIDARRRHDAAEPLDEELLPAGGDLELDYLRERYRSTFADAIKRAVRELPSAERALLRFHFVDGLTPGHIGGIYGVHRTTTMRRIDAAKELLLASTREHVMRELALSPSECDSLVALVRSRLPMTLSSLFRSRPP